MTNHPGGALQEGFLMVWCGVQQKKMQGLYVRNKKNREISVSYFTPGGITQGGKSGVEQDISVSLGVLQE